MDDLSLLNFDSPMGWSSTCAGRRTIIAVMLVPPYFQFHDLAIGLIGIAVALTSMREISDKNRNLIFLISLVPGLLVLLSPREHPIFPIMPVVLVFLFIYCLWKAFGSVSNAMS